MPLVLVEAMSHGLPLITSDLPICKEILGNFGLYFENGNIQELAQMMEESTHLDWTKKSTEAENIAQRFKVEYIIEKWKRIIES
jgi:glycosyltransferase involved in cell wall biosynthesis